MCQQVRAAPEGSEENPFSPLPWLPGAPLQSFSVFTALPVACSPVSGPGTCSPVSGPGTCSPVSGPGACSPVSGPGTCSPVSGPGVGSPVSGPGACSPVSGSVINPLSFLSGCQSLGSVRMFGHSAMSDLRPQGLQPTRLLCPWDFPGKNTIMGCHFLFQEIFPTQGLSPYLLCLLHCRWILYSLSHWGSPVGFRAHTKSRMISP